MRDLAERKINVLVQEFLPEADHDLRCFVVGGRVVASMERKARDGFRANLHAGSSARPLEASPQLRDLASRAAAAVGLDLAGVDLVRTKRGFLVLEVNPSPGLEGIESVTGVDVAAAVAELAIERLAARGPDRIPDTASVVSLKGDH